MELRDYLRDGGLFEARRQGNGADCTYEVLQSVVGLGLVENLVPGLGGGSVPGLGGLSALAAAVGRSVRSAAEAGWARSPGRWGDRSTAVATATATTGTNRRRSQSRRSGEWGRDDDRREGRSHRRADDRAGPTAIGATTPAAGASGRDRDWADPDVE